MVTLLIAPMTEAPEAVRHHNRLAEGLVDKRSARS